MKTIDQTLNIFNIGQDVTRTAAYSAMTRNNGQFQNDAMKYYEAVRLATKSPKARQAVSPGDSMPNRLIKSGTP